MVVAVDWPTKAITVNQSDITFVSGSLYEMDTDWFRLQLKALEDDALGGITFERTNDHITSYTVAGVTFARKVEIINGYTVEFLPDSSWTVRLAGSNNNIFDAEAGILTQNAVTVIGQNSAGLVVVSSSGLTAGESAELTLIRKFLLNKLRTRPDTGEMDLFDDDEIAIIQQWDIFSDWDGLTPYDGTTGVELRVPK